MPPAMCPVVIYVVIPSSAASLDSTAMRQVLSTIKRADKLPSQFLFHLVPESMMLGPADDRSLGRYRLSALVRDVYDRILQPSPVSMGRRLVTALPSYKFVTPAFILSRPTMPRVKFVREANPTVVDVMDRSTLLHVGYALVGNGKWIIAVCVDEYGEAHDVGVWHSQAENSETHLVMQVWSFALQFSRQANIEWRIAITKLGCMGEEETNGEPYSLVFLGL
jgi:mediator of RNA polymerase II transcription subunit 13, fungi type